MLAMKAILKQLGAFKMSRFKEHILCSPVQTAA
jgi:hypothetical protein